MKTCDSCRKTAEQMKSDLALPMKDSADVKGFRKFVNKKVWGRALIVIVIFAVLCVGEYVLKKKRASREIIEEDVEVIPDEEVFGEISEETSGDASNESAIEPAEDTVKEDKTE